MPDSPETAASISGSEIRLEQLSRRTCFICQQEERFNANSSPSNTWVHPCRCTLLAHRTCLVNWINAVHLPKAPDPYKMEVRCPQCNEVYTFAVNHSAPSRLLKVLDLGNKVVEGVVQIGMRALVVGSLLSFGRSIYTVFIAYGAASIRLYIGEEMYQILLSDDTLVWPWEAFIRLPWIPLNALLGSYLSIANILWDPLPAFLIWPASTAAAHRTVRRTLMSLGRSDAFPRGATAAWPPSPGFVHFLGIPGARFGYSLVRGRMIRRIAGLPRRENTAENALRQLVEDSDSEDEEEGDGDAENDEADEAIALQRRLGRAGWLARLGHSLLTPFYANGMGWLLGEAARHASWLKAGLGIKPALDPFAVVPAPVLTPLDFWKTAGDSWMTGAGRGEDVSSVTAFFRAFWGGTGLWASTDPVWFRNILGLGIFMVAKDALYALHLRYALRELRSRKIISRDFGNVDRSTLDLIPQDVAPRRLYG
ncbi:hypothetical protein EV714DRAFT_201789 [Schizophyllum commune]